MRQQILHTRKEFGISMGLNAEESLCWRKNYKRFCTYTDIKIYRHRCSSFLMFYGKEIGTISSKELYKFFDRDGNTLVLRPDITPSIARVAATFLDSKGLPVRLCYNGNTLINHSSYRGKLKESTQMGAELLGIDSLEADAEMIALAADCLKAAGLNEFLDLYRKC